MEVKSSASTKRPGSARSKNANRPGFSIGANTPWLASAIIVLVLCSSVAKLQKPALNAYQASVPLSKAWWLLPLERNAPARLPIIESDLRDIFLLPGSDHLWAVGAGGLIVHSRDGGRSWEKQEIADEGLPAAVGAVNHETAGFSFTATAVAGEQALEKKRPINQQQRRQQTDVLAVDSLKVPTSDITEQVTLSVEAIHLNSVFFLDENRGWAVGDVGHIIATTDGGTTWLRQDSGTAANLNGIVVGEDLQGVVVGDDDTIISTVDGGQKWNFEPRVASSADLFAVGMLAPSRLLPGSYPGNTIVVAGRNIIVTVQQQDQGKVAQSRPDKSGYAIQGPESFLQSSPKIAGNLYSLDFPQPNLGWMVGSFGQILKTQDGGRNWMAISHNITDLLLAVDFVNDSTGWVAGWVGNIYKTEDAGASWQPQESGTEETLRAVAFKNEECGWVIGQNGTLLATTDGGETWFPQTNVVQNAGAYSQYPAPWYFLGLLFVALLLVPALQKPKPDPDNENLVRESVADLLVSDRPLEMSDPDPLDFKPIALGLSRFLRNENTIPPLTVAITGKWGSGKSSLMNLVRTDLRANRFQSVWFNAWHHQKEEHLLAALLENVKAQAMPGWYTWHNVEFRYRLFKLRFQRAWPLFVGLFLVYSALFGFFVANPKAFWQLAGVIDSLTEKTMATIFLEGGALVALASTALGSLGLLWRGFRAFGLKPAKLMASMSGRFNVRDFTAQAGFRYKFEQEFREVTEALHPHNLVILIDDLDRCKPENVLEVLEAVNFLIASGSCFIIMGLDLDRVERCVGLGFKDVAEELLVERRRAGGNGRAESKEDAGRRRRAEFARQYLEKLINIEVPVPEPTPEQAEQLLVPQQPDEAQFDPLGFLSLLVMPLRKAWPAVLILATLACGYWLGSKQSLKFNLEKKDTPTEIAATRGSAEAPENSKQGAVAAQEQAAPARVGRFEPGETSDAFNWYPALLTGILLVGVVRRMVVKPGMVVKDSPEFQQALRVWQPFIYSRQNTPRYIKRFMNRIRYFAMRLPSEDAAAPVSIVTRLLLSLRLKPDGSVSETTEATRSIPEATLVALGALQNFNHKWLEDERIWASIAAGQLEIEINGYSKNEISKIKKNFTRALDAHKKNFHDWPPRPEQVDELLRLSEGIRVS